MENASKALLIAGGILLSIIVITILVVTYNNIVGFQLDKLEEQELQNIELFNEPFMSYNKKVMYGTDIISVLNLSLDNNKKYNVDFGEEYYVDISFKLNSDLSNITELYELNTSTGVYTKRITEENTIIQGNKTYKISENRQYIEEKIISKLADKEQTTNIIEKDGAVLKKYTIISNFIYDLKRKTFTCKGVEVDSIGRIKSMSFEQK